MSRKGKSRETKSKISGCQGLGEGGTEWGGIVWGVIKNVPDLVVMDTQIYGYSKNH